MNPAKIYKITNRLAEVVRRPGGRTVREAVAGAEARIADIRDDCLATLEDKRARLQPLVQAAKDTPGGEAVAALYDLANQIFSLAGAFGLPDLAEAAYGLCELVDDTGERGSINWSAVDVQVNGVWFLASVASAQDPARRAAILQGLRDLSAHLAAEI